MSKSNEKNEPERSTRGYSGKIKDKNRTMSRLVDAVGIVLKEKGYRGLTAPNIAEAANVSRRLIWMYFGGIENLIDEFFRQRDFWKSDSNNSISELLNMSRKIESNDIAELLSQQFSTLLQDDILQKIIHWELGEYSASLRKIADEREEIGEKLFEAIEPRFHNPDVNVRAIMAVAIGGIYYLSLHAKTNGSTFCGIDINNGDGKAQIEKAIHNIVNTTFEIGMQKKEKK
jgi:AcrR family transcriptional regulator